MIKIIVNRIALCIMVMLGLACCSSRGVNKNHVSQEPIVKPTPGSFTYPTVPQSIKTPKERVTYLVKNYWENFDASDTLLLNNVEVTEQHFVNFISLFNMTDDETITHGCKLLLEKTREYPSMLQYILELSEKYLYDGNSPFHNDTYFNAFLKSASFDTLEETMQDYWKRLIRITSINNVGMKANNIEWKSVKGQNMSLYNITAKYIILFFNNPDCDECKQVKKQLQTINMPADCKVVSVYPDDNLDMWRESLNTVPYTWINGYDPGMQITKKQIYDLKVIPTLYLIDAKKIVILKDTTPEQIAEYLNHM